MVIRKNAKHPYSAKKVAMEDDITVYDDGSYSFDEEFTDPDGNTIIITIYCHLNEHRNEIPKGGLPKPSIKKDMSPEEHDALMARADKLIEKLRAEKAFKETKKTSDLTDISSSALPKNRQVGQPRPAIMRNGVIPASKEKMPEFKKTAYLRGENKCYSYDRLFEMCAQQYRQRSRKKIKSIDITVTAEDGDLRVYYRVNDIDEGLYIDL